MDLHEYFGLLPVPERLKNHILDPDGKPLYKIENLSKINVFIGENNSGKSLLIREIVKQNPTNSYPNKFSTKEIEEPLIRDLTKKVNRIFENVGSTQIFEGTFAISRESLAAIINRRNDNIPLVQELDEMSSELRTLSNKNFNFRSIGEGQAGLTKEQTGFVAKNLSEIVNSIDSVISQLKVEKILGLRRFYIPTIRTLRVFNSADSVLLNNKIDKEYGFQSFTKGVFDQRVDVYSGESFFNEVFSLRNLDVDSDDRIEDFEHFLSSEFFKNEKIKIITNKNENVIHIKIGKEKEQKIHNLGDGLQMIVILTFPIFTCNGGWIAIEEPEMFLHPGLQKRVIELLASHPKSNNFQFFITTHSNHVLEAALQSPNSSIFSISKVLAKQLNEPPKFTLKPLAYGDSEFLRSIGVENTSVFLSNCSIWVEGVTDRLYIQKYLNEYLKAPKLNSKYEKCLQFKEGINYNFVLSAGDNIIHNDFSEDLEIGEIDEQIPIKYLCGSAMVIVDHDYNKSKKRKQQLEEKLGLAFYELPVVEVENLLSFDSIISSIRKFPSCKDFELIKKFKEEDYANERMGTFIDNQILQNLKNPKKKKFSDTSGTLNCKYQFCINSLDSITYENMTKSSKELVEKILDFIISKN